MLFTVSSTIAHNVIFSPIKFSCHFSKTTATQFKTYQVSYFNALKAYIESMTDIETIGAVVYGIEIPAEHQSDVLKVLLAAMATGGETE